VLRIEKVSDGGFIVLKLSGRMAEEHLAQLQSEIEKSGGVAKLDLKDINLVDRSSVRFLVECESQGIELLNRPLYVQEWMSMERKQGSQADIE
jgi:ABC-type transporter Mla MlaB component